jgi:hypothetical protein
MWPLCITLDASGPISAWAPAGGTGGDSGQPALVGGLCIYGPGSARRPAFTHGSQHGPLDRRMRRVLDLDPFLTTARAIAAVAPLGDDPLQSHRAHLRNTHCAVDVLDVLVEPDACVGVRQKLHQQGAAVAPMARCANRGHIQFQQIEGV